MDSTANSADKLLRQAPLLQHLSADDIARVAGIATVEVLEASTVLFPEGGHCDRLYLVIKGLVALDMCVPRRGCVRLMTVGPREVVGVSALLSNARMTVRATIVEDATLVVFPARQLRKLCDADHDIGYAVMTQLSLALASRLLATRLQLLDVFYETQPAGSIDR
jgi:CRP-like cAMP-binding protein